MLRKRGRPAQKDHNKGFLMPQPSSESSFSDGVVKKTTSTSFLGVPGLLVGFSSKSLSESDAVRSPTSPLDKVFSSIGNSNLGSPRSATNVRSKCWHSSRVGLGLVDSLSEDNKSCTEELGKNGSRNIVFGSQMRLKISISKTFQVVLRDDDRAPKSLTHDYGILSKPCIEPSKSHSVFSKIATEWKGAKLEHEGFGLLRSCSLDTGRSSLLKSVGNNLNSNSEVLQSESKNSALANGDSNFDKIIGSLPVSISSSHEIISSLTASEIEQSEDYTCIISHGPNPRMTHIFGDCIIETHTIESPTMKNSLRKVEEGSSGLSKPHDDFLSCSSDDHLSFCFSCKKKLQVQKDVYMHRGNKAFCSCECYDKVTPAEEEMEKLSNASVEEMFLEEVALAS